jgi:hypothetical protein
MMCNRRPDRSHPGFRSQLGSLKPRLARVLVFPVTFSSPLGPFWAHSYLRSYQITARDPQIGQRKQCGNVRHIFL